MKKFEKSLEHKAQQEEAIHKANVEQQEGDIDLMISVFSDKGFNSFEEYDAWCAQNEINLAQESIKMLQKRIDWLKHVVSLCETRVQKFKQLPKNNNESNRPKRSEEKVRIAKKFIMQWVYSLKRELAVKSCAKLEALLPNEIALNSERNWRRWLRGDAIPTYKTFNALLSFEIKTGKFDGRTIYDVPVDIDHNSILTLLRFL